MKIIVVGCGKIGATIVESLVSEGHDVTVVDQNAAVVSQMVEMYDCMGFCGSGTDCNALQESGVEDCELFIAVTGSDEFNMLSCFMARGIGAHQTIARIRNPEYNDRNLGFIRKQLGLSMAINPELLAAKETYNILQLPPAIKTETFSRRSFEMIELRIKDKYGLDGLSVMEVRKKLKAMFLICAVERDNEVFIPDGNFVLKNGDRIGITASTSEIVRLFKLIGLENRQVRSVMILGATTTAFYLAKMLISVGTTVKIIDQSEERCRQFSELLPDAVIIHGDAATQEVLLEEGVKSTDAFAALTGIDEENILLSLFAESQNVPKVIAKVTRDDFAALSAKIGIESTVSPRHLIADVLVSYARGLENSRGSKMETLYKIMDNKAEVLEFNIQPDCSIIGIPLKKMQTKDNVLIAGIVRGRKPFIPTGDDSIHDGDMVIVCAAGHRINDVADIIK